MRTAALAAVLGVVTAVPAAAAPWRFTEPVAVTDAHGEGIFHHLESAGRRSIAVAGHTVALVWEDNRSGTARVYVAYRDRAGGFTQAQAVSGDDPAYEPAIAASPGGGFIVAWEEGEAVWLRQVSPEGMSPAVEAARPAWQATVAAGDGRLYAGWASKATDHAHIRVAALARAEGELALAESVRVDPEPLAGAQLYPSLAVTDAGVVVGWEDRRHGHTRLYTSFAGHDGAFGPIRQLNELPPPMSDEYGKGTGAMRVTLKRIGPQRVFAAWMDKRDFYGGYDVYAAFSDDGGRHFGANEAVQDAFGSSAGQWHPAVAVGPDDRMLAAWDDDRDGSQDVWLSWKDAGGQWGEDLPVPPAHGAGHQSHPAVAIDAQGRLHIAWVSQDGPYAPTRLWYVQGTPSE